MAFNRSAAEIRRLPSLTPLLRDAFTKVEADRNILTLFRTAWNASQACSFHATNIWLKKTPNVWKDFPIKPDRFAAQFPTDGKYTSEPLHTLCTGGRHPESGRRIFARIGGGTYRKYYWVDRVRANIPANEAIEERIVEVRGDRNRSAYIALLAHGDEKRWVMATQNMKPGDTVKSSRKIEALPVNAVDGDTHAVGALAMGTMICSIEPRPGDGQRLAQAAGNCAQVARRLGDQIIIRMSNKSEISVNEKCLVTVGKMSNPEHSKNKYLKAGHRRAEGFRPRSGLWQRKDGYCGRKVRPLPPIRKFDLGSDVKKEYFLQLSRPIDTRFWAASSAQK